jgi:hypothetical protein
MTLYFFRVLIIMVGIYDFIYYLLNLCEKLSLLQKK